MFVKLVYFLGLSFVTGELLGELAFKELVDDFWEWRLQNNPEFASNVGDHRYTELLENYTIEAIDTRKVANEGFLRRLSGVDRSSLGSGGRVTYDVLKDTIQTWLDGYEWRFYGPMNPVSRLDGPHTNYMTRAGQVKFQNETDFRKFAQRIGAYSVQIDQMITRMRKAIEMNTTFHRMSVQDVPGKLLDITTKFQKNVTAFPMYEPFTQDLDKTVTDTTKKTEIRTAARENVERLLNKLKELAEFINNTYIPNTRSGFGVWSLPRGLDYYKACLKWQLSVDDTPEEIHDKGLTEVARVHRKLLEIIERANFTGTVQAYNDYVRMNDSLWITDANMAIAAYKKSYKEVILPKLPDLFSNIPDFPLLIEANPMDGPVGIYKNGAPDGSRPGIFYANVISKVSTFGIAALLAHETDPGHHLQDAYALTSPDIPMFRKATDFSKYFAAPLHYPFYTAYSEGWGLYSEDLGEEMGIYQNDLERFGKYGMEIFRAARLVVDTGIHAKRWSREKAIEYMKNYTSLSETTIASEIDRYSTWPGQATSYMIGQLKIRELRNLAETRLGKRFDIKGFHGILLNNGAMPLSVMEDVVYEWIKRGMDPISAAQHPAPVSVGFVLSFALSLTMFV